MMRGETAKVSMGKKTLFFFLLAILLLPSSALAQSYSFSIPESTVDVFWNSDGTQSLLYEWIFRNSAGGAPIDFVDIGLPNDNFDLGSITAEVDGQPITDIEISPYVDHGVALGLGENSIQPGQTGRVRAVIPVLQISLSPDDTNPDYLSANFAPTYFDPQFVQGETNLTVIFHLPPGVQTEEPRYHSAPAGFSEVPESAMDEEGRIVYIWRNPNARLTKSYNFGASFPQQYVTQQAEVESAVPSAGVSAGSGGGGETVLGWVGACLSLLPFTICFGMIGLIIWAAARSGSRRKMQYLPPKVAIEGHGIKRGLTAVEAAILMEQPVDKIMTMILFSTIKKAAATVTTRDPLELEVTDPLPEGLREYEINFLAAFQVKSKSDRRKALQDMMVSLVKSVSEKMKGFSRKETVAYYQDIVERGWQQVESAETPEVKSARYDEVMEWTMLDREFEDRTRRTFTGGPVFVPMWWPRYDPGYPRTVPSAPKPAAGAPIPTGKGGQTALPHLPGSDFAASMVNSVQGVAAGVIGSVTDFTGAITNRTNPIPKAVTSSSKGTWKGGSSGGFSCACACACACAGCACACAGGGR